jgi:hypothetical protein
VHIVARAGEDMLRIRFPSRPQIYLDLQKLWVTEHAFLFAIRELHWRSAYLALLSARWLTQLWL